MACPSGCPSGLFGKPREGYYSVSRERRHQRVLLETDIVRMVQEIRAQAPGIGAYKLFLILREEYSEKMIVRDKFYGVLHRKHLMQKPQKRRHTTNSNHNYHKYRNIIKGMKLTQPNQLWVADITYIDTDDGVCYLHLVTDAFTHEIIGRVLSDTLMAVNSIEALNQAIAQAGNEDLSHLVHHSDRGSQYCCNAYVARLGEIHASISMTEDYKPTDNAIAERVNGIIKQEWLYKMKRPANRNEAEKLIRDIVEFYNNKRPHMSRRYADPCPDEGEVLQCSATEYGRCLRYAELSSHSK